MRKIILIIALLFTTGCYNYLEPDNLAIITTIAIDYYDGNYQITLEIEESASKGEISSYIINTKNKDIKAGFKELALFFNKVLFFTSLDILVITPEIAEHHLDQLTDFLINEHNLNFNFYIAISERPEVIIEIINNKDYIFGIYLKELFDNNEYYLSKIDYITFLNSYLKSESI